MEKEKGPELSIYSPEKIVTPETGMQGQESVVLGIDKETGKIVFHGNPPEAQEWLGSERGKKYQQVVEEKGGVIMPGAVETHNHPILWTIFDDARDLSEISSLSEAQKYLKERAKDNPENPVLAINLRTEKIKKVAKEDLDVVSRENPVLVIDPSFHGAILNSKGIEELQKTIPPEEMDSLAGTFNKRTGQITEEFVMRAFELVSPSVEVIKERAEKNIESYLSKGITGIHDLEMSSWNQFLAYLMMRKDWRSKENAFPIERTFISPHVLEKMFKSIKDLEKAGLWDEEIFPTIGLKIIMDGSLGSHTAKLAQRYLDQDTRGEWAIKMERMNRAIKMALEQGVENIAFHAIGDEAIAKVLETVGRWEKTAKEIQNKPLDVSRWRIEHFELPSEESIKTAATMGIWVSEQPNFLSDGVDYVDRLGDRTRLICPHRKLLKAKVPMMFGSDGMPTSALYGIWAATHAVEESQRLDFSEALAAYSIMGQRNIGREQGKLKAGERADMMILATEDLKMMQGPAARDYKEFKKAMVAAKKQYAELKTIKTIMAGKEVKRK